MFLFLFVLNHDYGVVLFLSSSITATDYPSLMSVFCEMVYVQQEHITALGLSQQNKTLVADSSNQLSGVSGCFLLHQDRRKM